MLHKLFTLPLKAVIKVGEKIKEEADRELYDLEFIQQQLVQLQMLLEMGEITEQEYAVKEEELLLRYEIAMEREQSNTEVIEE
ncbi:gas vesicle protein GvpG [Alkalihalobacterium chitinilyticum]|uniref:Gas vesicle protein GvpG n=1 Tax=Alkalihalobacterium chitinilyticum TaxID=2980103 RepID=A0ABT5VDX7_9BACI|nr:gas vesicle protein GvpG [Alkalihalobacterium chitinilyticum]MDE5413661.1 gas vesicle protein GvpG [Alkalihalobacterium chitinilyticum]